MRHLLIIAASFLPLATFAQQTPPPITLGAPLAEFAKPFSDVASAIELPDGRVMFVDRDERIVRIADFATGTASTIGRDGDGPGEYRHPSRLVQLPGDTILIRGNARYVVVAPGAKLTDRVLNQGPLVQMLPGGVDAMGRLYFQGPTHDFRTGGARDSTPIFRVDRPTMRPDTIAWVRLRADDGERKTTGQVTTIGVTTRPFDPMDVWGVAADGTVYIARVSDYHIDIISPDKGRTAAPPVPWEKLGFSGAERAAVKDLPKTRPPFLKSTDPSPRVAPDGTFWVPRSTASVNDPLRFDVLDRSGRRVRTVVLPPVTRLVGFSARYMYTAREDADGFHFLQRRAYPG